MKNIIIVILLLVASFGVKAQECPKRKAMMKRFEAQKVAYITQELDLTPQESQKFWPVFNEMNKKLNELKKKKAHKRRPIVVEEMSDKEVMVLCDEILQTELDRANIKKEYFDKIKKILPAKKVFRLLHVERDFKRKLLGKIGCKHRHGHDGPGK